MTTCSETIERISAYHDGELSPALSDRVAGHLAECAGCRAYLLGVRRVGDLVRGGEGCRLPAGVWDRIAQECRTPAVRGPSRARRWAVRVAGIAAGFVLYILGYGALTSTPARESGRTVDEGAHVRRVLHETGVMLAGSRVIGPLEHRPESRLFDALIEETQP